MAPAYTTGMHAQNVPEKPDLATALRHLSLEEVEERIAKLDAERAAWSLIRRSIIARERARKRAYRRSMTAKGGLPR